MSETKPFLSLIGALLLTFHISAYAQSGLKPFVSGSYRQILADNANNPFMLTVWSVDCASCLKDMKLLSDIHKNNPDITMIMLSHDELSAKDDIEKILKQFELEGVENWVFADENSQKLRFEIDPKWYGELPRTYFFDADHRRTGISGAMSKEDYDDMLTKIIK
ncbi:MAG: TlpA family protein disulfide reductase [Gammaproteobacteria bacterium]